MALANRIRISVTLTPDMLEKVDKYAAEKGINRNAAINAAVATVLAQEKAMNIMPDLLKAYTELKTQQND